jgi:hypothetical protein
MNIEQNANLVKEWQALHNSNESYERFALIIKLTAILLTVYLISFSHSAIISMIFICILWIQEGIWKTYQIRSSNRIVSVEKSLQNIESDNDYQPEEIDAVAFQLYSQFNENRSGTIALIKEYLHNSLRPTVIFPYTPLIFIVFIF